MNEGIKERIGGGKIALTVDSTCCTPEKFNADYSPAGTAITMNLFANTRK